MTERATWRYETILAAYDAALDGRDQADVDIVDLLPTIYAAVPNVTDAEIVPRCAGLPIGLSARPMRSRNSGDR